MPFLKQKLSSKRRDYPSLSFWIILTLVISAIVLGGFIFKIIKSGEVFWNSGVVYDITGQVGDFVGGVIGTVFSAGAFILMYLTLREQIKNTANESFEDRFMSYWRFLRKVTRLWSYESDPLCPFRI